MTKTSTRGGLLTRALSCGCAVALAASLAPAAGIAWAATNAPALTPPDAGPTYVNIGTLDEDGNFDVFSSASVNTADLTLTSNAALYFDSSSGWSVAYTNAYATLESILEAAELDQYWTSDAKLYYGSASDASDATSATKWAGHGDFDGKYYFPDTKSDSDTTKLTGPAEAVEPGLAYTLWTSPIGGDVFTTAGSDATSAADTAKGTVDLMKAAVSQQVIMPVAAQYANIPSVMNGLTVSEYQNKWDCTVAKVLSASDTIAVNIAVPEAVKTSRIWGEDWADTMVASLDATFNSANGNANGSSIVLATASSFQDALAASGLAGALKCPIIMTDGDSLTPQAAEWMQDYLNNPAGAKIYVIGGEVAIKPAVVDAIKQLPDFYGQQASGFDIKRIWGDEAWDTALEIREAMVDGSITTTMKGGANDVIVACSGGFEDAMSIAPFAYATGTPVILTDNSNKLSDDTVAALVGLDAANKLTAGTSIVNIVGGRAVVSEQVEAQLAGAKVYRTSGQSAYDTSNKVASLLLDNDDRFLTSDTSVYTASVFTGATVTKTTFACGENYLDALASAAYCGTAITGKSNSGGTAKASVLLLVSNSDETTVDGFLSSNAKINGGSIERAVIFGGEGVLGKAVQMDINQALVNPTE